MRKTRFIVRGYNFSDGQYHVTITTNPARMFRLAQTLKYSESWADVKAILLK
jgi:hypothetical protein